MIAPKKARKKKPRVGRPPKGAEKLAVGVFVSFTEEDAARLDALRDPFVLTTRAQVLRECALAGLAMLERKACNRSKQTK